jgi:PAS domain S-box-containing protein
VSQENKFQGHLPGQNPEFSMNKLKLYLSLDDEDLDLLRRAYTGVSANIDNVLDVFYQKVLNNPMAAKVFRDSDSSVDILKGTLKKWIQELFNSELDQIFLQRQIIIGMRHVKVNLPQTFMVLGMNVLCLQLYKLLKKEFIESPKEFDRAFSLLYKRTEFCLAIMLKSYQDLREKGITVNEEKRFSNILENAHDEIYVFDAKSLKFLVVNYGARKNLGYSMAELREMTPLDLKPEFTFDSFSELIDPLLKGEKEKIVFTTIHRRKDETLYPVEIHLQFSDPEKLSFVAIILDITEKKKKEEEIDRQREENEQLKKQEIQNERLIELGRMSASIAHEIKNPLAGINGAISVILGGLDKDDENKEVLEAILGQTDRLNKTVVDLLQFSRPVKIHPQSIALTEIVKATKSLFDGISEFAKVTIEIKKTIEKLVLYVDPVQFQQVLLNLFINASHAMSAKGTIQIYSEDSKDSSTIFIQDTGPGISVEWRERIFQPFETSKTQGTGLGLPNCKKIIEEHDGEISIEDSEQGALFKITIPKKINSGSAV